MINAVLLEDASGKTAAEATIIGCDATDEHGRQSVRPCSFEGRGGGTSFPLKLDKDVAELMADKDIQRHGGIYEFLLSDRKLFEKLNLQLNLRAFDSDDMRVAYEGQKGVCPICKGKFALIGSAKYGAAVGVG